MEWNRSELKKQARQTLKNHYWECACAYMMPILVLAGAGLMIHVRSSFLSGILMPLAALLLLVMLYLPLRVGCARLALRMEKEQGEYSDILYAFRNHYGNIVQVMLFQRITILLWSLLLIVPGIMHAYELLMVPYLLADHPDTGLHEALQTSREMMKGEKKKAFLLDLSMAGWMLLELVTGGLAGIFWTEPYIGLTHAQLYSALKEKVPVVESPEDEEEETRGAFTEEEEAVFEEELIEEDGSEFEELISEEDPELEEEPAVEEGSEFEEEPVPEEDFESEEQPAAEENLKNEERQLPEEDLYDEEPLDTDEKLSDEIEKSPSRPSFLDDTVSIPVKLIDFMVPDEEEENETRAGSMDMHEILPEPSSVPQDFLDDTVSIPVEVIDFIVPDEEI